jgi:ABC-2 type transport system permease protein
MTAVSSPAPAPAAAAPTETRRPRSVPRAGWMIVGSKEFGDHLLSARFVVLVIVLGLAAAIPLYFAAATIREAASTVTDAQAIFIALFWLAPDVGEGGFSLPSVTGFLAYVAPLLGLAFAFDAINGERADGTLPRLLSQPIHRDDVINGKFAAGLAVIGIVLVSVVGAIAAFGLIRLGIVPAASEVLRIVLWILLTFVYVALWLAFGMLLSVGIRRAATSALVGFGTWLLLTFFGGLIVSLIGGVLAPAATSAEEQLSNIGVQETLRRFLPDTLYREA